eukprot:3940479-Rhodomonas_salina.3
MSSLAFPGTRERGGVMLHKSAALSLLAFAHPASTGPHTANIKQPQLFGRRKRHHTEEDTRWRGEVPGPEWDRWT